MLRQLIKRTWYIICCTLLGLPQECPNYNGLPLGFDNTISLFMIIIFGLFVSICLFLVEVVVRNIMGFKGAILESYGKRTSNISFNLFESQKDDIIRDLRYQIDSLNQLVAALKAKVSE